MSAPATVQLDAGRLLRILADRLQGEEARLASVRRHLQRLTEDVHNQTFDAGHEDNPRVYAREIGGEVSGLCTAVATVAAIRWAIDAVARVQVEAADPSRTVLR